MRPLVLVFALALLAGACGDETATSTTNGGPRVGCPFGGPFFPLSVVDTAPPLLEDSEAPEIADAIAGFLSEMGEPFPVDGWRLIELVERDSAWLVHVGTPEVPVLSFMSVDWDDGWVWDGASIPNDCVLEFESDLDASVVDWELDPDTTLTPDRTSVVVIATERACTSGQAIGNRLDEPQVILTADSVSIGLSARPVGGDQDCPDNPAQRIVVDLGEPLGDREIRDARSSGLGELRDLLVAAIEREG